VDILKLLQRHIHFYEKVDQESISPPRFINDGNSYRLECEAYLSPLHALRPFSWEVRVAFYLTTKAFRRIRRRCAVDYTPGAFQAVSILSLLPRRNSLRRLQLKGVYLEKAVSKSNFADLAFTQKETRRTIRSRGVGKKQLQLLHKFNREWHESTCFLL